MEGLVALNNNSMIWFLNGNMPIFDTVMIMLKPLDIISLALATYNRVRPSRGMSHIYMKWWRQIFHNMRWAEQNGRKITIIGKNLARLQECLKSWTYDKTAQRLDLVVVVQETLLTWDPDEKRQGLLQSIDEEIPYASTDTERLVRRFETPIQMCVIFLEDNICIDLDWTWLDKLLEQIEISTWWEVLDLDNPLPAGLYLGIPQVDTCMKTCYANLNLPDLTIDTAINRHDVQIRVARDLTWHEVDGSAIRIAVTKDGVLISSMLRRHNRDISGLSHGGRIDDEIYYLDLSDSDYSSG
jgi:hypothetical protein